MNISTRNFRTFVLKNIEVETNDPESPMVTLTMKAKILEILSVSPQEIDFGKVKVGSEYKRAINLVNKGKEVLTVSKINTVPSQMISVSPQGEVKIDPGKTVSLELRFQPTQVDEYFYGWVNITEHPGNMQKSIKIKAKVIKE